MSKELKIPSTWVQVPFSDLFLDPKNNIVGGPFGSNLKSNEYRTEGIPVFRIQNIGRNKFIDKNINFVTEEKAEFLSKHSFKSGDIIITKLGDPLGKTCFVPKKYETGIIVADLIRVRVDNQNINPKFLVYQFNSPFFIKQFDSFTKGTTRPRIKLSVVRDLIFNLPPLNEQNNIVDVIEELFSDLDNGLENLKVAQKQINIYRYSLLHNALKGNLTNKWRKINNPESAEKLLDQIKFSRKEQYKQQLQEWNHASETWKKNDKKGDKPKKPKLPISAKNIESNETLDFTSIPESWSYCRIKEIAELVSGYAFKANQFTQDGYYKVIRMGNLYDNKLDMTRNPVSLPKDVPDTIIEQYSANEEDILLTLTGTKYKRDYGYAVKVPTGEKNLLVNQRILSLKPLINNSFMLFLLRGKLFRDHFFSLETGGSNQGNVSSVSVGNIVVQLPSEIEQTEITNILESQFSIIDILEKIIDDSIQKSEVLRQSILKKAFEGNLVAQNSGDESAPLLLKRIQKERKKHQEDQKSQKKKSPKKTRKMSKKLSIIDVLKASDKPMLAKDVWQQSIHNDDIEEFYSKLKNIQDSIKEVKKGTESLLSFTK
jgi:type I restriction enzyme S subunit